MRVRPSQALACGFLAFILAIGTIAVSLAARPGSDGPRGGAQRTTERPAQRPGLQFRLSAVAPVEAPSPRVPAGPATPLDAGATRALLARVPGPEAIAADERGFFFPPKSLPAPRTGKTMVDAFPTLDAPAPPPAPASGPLTVLRHAPDGEVPLAPHVSVTFSQTMNALTSQEDLSATPAPLVITLQPPGTWRWLGTQTLVLQAQARLPMATDYRVKTPAGTKSVSGSALAKAERWVFSTPPPALVSSYPRDGAVRRDPVLVAVFDQHLEPATALYNVTVTAGLARFPLRLATPEEVEADQNARKTVERAEEGRSVAFRVEEPLPSDSHYLVTIGAGTPSVEGPKVTVESQSWAMFSLQTGQRFRACRSNGPTCRGLCPAAWCSRATSRSTADSMS